ncbi:hypothetical protein GTQ40_15150 [Flavobacteriaceae bacterium R38]|nr:hypothetical protein [Flavobacteriaceae bacterium R38]
MLLVYTHKITPRFTYIMKHVFTNMLRIEVSLTTKIEDFIKHAGAKITYTKQPLQNEFFIKSHDLLYEQGIRDIDIKVQQWGDIPCFFQTNEKSAIPFDVFAASFYLISRYEEYLPHVKDMHGRYSVNDSIAYQNGFLDKPIVDIWVAKLKQALLKRFPYLVLPKKEFKHISLIDVSVSHCYKERGIIRSFGGVLIDLFSFRIKRTFSRLVVLLGIRKDPYDNFQELVKEHQKHKINAIFFFLFADYSNYDKNISVNNNRFRYLIKSIADYDTVSLMASYDSFKNVNVLKRDRTRFIDLIKRPVKEIRLRYNRVDIPESYRNLVNAEFSRDYSMGYRLQEGFRAGTCTPFSFYDISFEMQLPLKVNPFCVEDYSLVKYKNLEQAKSVLNKLKEEVAKVNGTFITVFSNEMIGGYKNDFIKQLYLELIKE